MNPNCNLPNLSALDLEPEKPDLVKCYDLEYSIEMPVSFDESAFTDDLIKLIEEHGGLITGFLMPIDPNEGGDNG